ncbi:hypothetical protein [Phyllobacterium phragmitis]|uniref:DUF3102 domain-containing protein n=1 Tax=Phyllobacterium phragmitis TaxID=2670329 RepID=A0ABQ0GWL8_9HYPH
MAHDEKSPPKSGAKKFASGLVPLQRVLLDEADRPIAILSEGKEQQTTVGKVVVRKLMQTAASGSPHALGHAMKAIVAAQQLKQQEIDSDVEFARRYRKHQQDQLKEAVKAGRDPETILPHPDDIEVIEGQGYRIVGPSDADELRTVKSNRAYRDVLLLQVVLEERLAGTSENSSAERLPSTTPLVLAQVLNTMLPVRYRLSDFKILLVLDRHGRMSKRELLKETRQAWQRIRVSPPRGWMMPPWSKIQAKLDVLLPACVNVYAQVKAGKLTSEHQIAARLSRLGNF